MNPSAKPAQKKSLFYGWIIVLCGVLMLGATHGVVTNCFSLFIIPVSSDLGVSREAFSVCMTFVNGLYALISFLSGRIYRRVPVITTMKIAAFVLPASYFAYSFCRSLPAFYTVAFFVGISVSFLSFLPFTNLISNWFEEKRGTALGLCFMGSGLGGMVFNAGTAILLSRLGWQSAYRVIGVLMLIILVPIVFFVLKETPAEKGLLPLGVGTTEAPSLVISGPSVGRAVRSLSFFALILLALIIGFTSTVIGNVIVTHLCDLGFPQLYASNVVTAYLGTLAITKILLGRLYDRIGARKGTAVSMMGFIIGFTGLLLGRYTAAHLLILVAALGTASSNVSYPVLARYAFGNRNYSTLYGFLMGTNFVTCSFAVVIANMINTATGSYNGVHILCIVISAIAIALLPFIRPVPEK